MNFCGTSADSISPDFGGFNFCVPLPHIRTQEEGTLLKQGYIRIPELNPDLLDETLIVSYPQLSTIDREAKDHRYTLVTTIDGTANDGR